MTEPKPHTTPRTAMRTLLATIALLFASTALAQWDYDHWQAYMAQYDANMDAWIAQQQAQIAADEHEWEMGFVRLYQEATGDYQAPHAVAFERGMNIYCERNPVECREFFASLDGLAEVSRRGHEANMRDIASWGASQSGIAASNASILDASHQGFRDREAMRDQGHANMIQGAVQGHWNYGTSNAAPQWSLPVMPDPHTQYWTPEGQPLSFDFQSGVWYVGTQGGWTPLQPQR